jgi:hypothetical protein
MQVTACTPQAMGALLAVGPDMAECLAVVTLYKTFLGSVVFNLDNDTAEN